jgi:hypothetical protein
MRVPHSFAFFANEWALDFANTLDWTMLDPTGRIHIKVREW